MEDEMFSAIPNNEQLVALHKAFEKACLELGLGPDQAVRREQLEQIMVSLSDRGERDADLIGAKAVHQMRPPTSGLFHQV
jgi:hypothetical protein